MPLQSFDEQLRKRILEDCDSIKGPMLANTYEQAQLKLQTQVYPNIVGAEPNLSDHGATHILNVKDNARYLLSDDGVVRGLSGVEMYCLGMFILFHDAGNVLGRDDHHKKVGRVFDQIRPELTARHEKSLVIKATGAHTGSASDGSRDTLKEVGELEHLEGLPVRLRELAAVLRFADELAEGPQRTSEFMLNTSRYSTESRIFHQYASSTNIFIDRSAGRIVMTYEVEIDVDGPKRDRRRDLTKFLQFVYKRVLKLNQERQYARYYSILLTPFRSTEVSFNFHCGGDILDSGLAPLKLTDIVIPGDSAKDVKHIDPQYTIGRLVADLLSKCRRKG